jgi:hypothetical protein
MKQEREIDLIALIIWSIKSIIKHVKLILLFLLTGLAYGFYNYFSATTIQGVEKIAIYKLNLPKSGSFLKLCQSLLQEDKLVLMKLLNIHNDQIINNFYSISLDSANVPYIVVKTIAVNEQTADTILQTFNKYYNNLQKEELIFEIERCNKIIDKFYMQKDSIFSSCKDTYGTGKTISLKEQVDDFEKITDFLKRKKMLLNYGALTPINSYSKTIVIGKPAFTLKYLMIGALAGILIALTIELRKKIIPYLKD